MLRTPLSWKQVKDAAQFTLRAREVFEKKGYEVQTTRVATQPWEYYKVPEIDIIDLVSDLEELLLVQGIDFFSIGTTTDSEKIPLVFDILKNTQTAFCSVTVSKNKMIDFKAAQKTAGLIKSLSGATSDGFTNLRFAALFNLKAGCPFFPAAYHKGPMSFAIGLENSDLVYEAFSQAGDIEKAGVSLKKILTREYHKIEKIAESLASSEGIRYGGIDVSIAPSVKRTESVVFGLERLNLGKFGEVGTLTGVKAITDTLRALDVKLCGYSGLMLPLMEDYGLAQRNNEGSFNLANLLLYSAVCGTGLDTIPLPGHVSEKKIYALLLDIASLSLKLKKPLSARLMPIPGKKAGDMTEFDFPYFVNSRVMDI